MSQICSFVVALLICKVRNLYAQKFDFSGITYEVNSDRAQVVLLEAVILNASSSYVKTYCESDQQTRFSNASVSNQNQLEEVVAAHTQNRSYYTASRARLLS